MLLNACGSAVILASLAFDFNLSATLIEGAWCAIALCGAAHRFSLQGAAR